MREISGLGRERVVTRVGSGMERVPVAFGGGIEIVNAGRSVVRSATNAPESSQRR